jgi:hypothetical protein
MNDGQFADAPEAFSRIAALPAISSAALPMPGGPIRKTGRCCSAGIA